MAFIFSLDRRIAFGGTNESCACLGLPRRQPHLPREQREHWGTSHFVKHYSSWSERSRLETQHVTRRAIASVQGRMFLLQNTEAPVCETRMPPRVYGVRVLLVVYVRGSSVRFAY